MKVQYSALATTEFKSIAKYFKNINPVVAKSVTEDIKKTVRLLARHPGIGKPQDAPDTRRAITSRYGYLVYYRESLGSQFIEIITIRHGRQNRPFQDS
jgi:plasmid stabilization system protein ParE